jgi:stage II sporulation protein AB (anti-sigma F factor)
VKGMIDNMDTKNEMKLEFLGISENEAFARVVVAAFAAQLDPTLDEINDVKMAVSEAVTNSIVHGYEGTVGKVCIGATLDENEIEIEITDNGRGIENVELARQPMYTTGSEDERSGMGFTVMETFMDSIEVFSEVGRGTVVKMRKTIKRPENE